MIRITSENELLNLFRPIDRDEVQVPADMTFPLIVRDYIKWIEPSGHRAYLVFLDPDQPQALGVVFRRTSSSDSPAQMCQWCHSVRSGNGVGLLTSSSGTRRRVGLYLCRDLGCKEQLTEGPRVNDMRETLDVEQKMQRVLRRMADFAKGNLF